MASDQQVTARAVFDAVMELRRLGTRKVLEHLEQVEPDLTNYLLETLTDVHQQILTPGTRGIGVVMPLTPENANGYFARVRDTVIAAERRSRRWPTACRR